MRIGIIAATGPPVGRGLHEPPDARAGTGRWCSHVDEARAAGRGRIGGAG
jgi:hypothetical protein